MRKLSKTENKTEIAENIKMLFSGLKQTRMAKKA